VLTIGELASYAGVTVRTVRHYHAKGLLPEPERDASGYRRYDANAVVELIRIRTLAEAGVPLSRVRELLAAGPEEFARAVAEIDRRLRAEIRERERHRERIARLAAGDSLALPDEVVAFLDRLRALGIDERVVEIERDGWILLAARAPDRVPGWMEQKTDPDSLRVYRLIGAFFDLPDGDPRREAVADELDQLIRRAIERYGEQALGDDGIERPVAALLDSAVLDAAPEVRQLLDLLEQRGWTGWTVIRRTG
jgi:DNA-binding transcriptional MerR regulator